MTYKDNKMFKRLSIVLASVLLLVASGCGSSSGNVTTTPTRPAGINQVRQADITKLWEMRQLEINLDSSTTILLTLKEGSEVSGYFYLTRGNNVDFRISGESLIYQSTPAGASANITSDRFAFTATAAQGIAYSLQLIPHEKDDSKKVTPTVFFEVIYPSSGEIFVPMDTK
jgi:hypothetical protein